jgi:Domain of unknown function (DUF3850)
MTLTTGQPQSLEISAKVTEVLTPLHEPKPARTIHYLETPSERFRAIATQRQNFEVVKNDRDYREGDILVLQETPYSTEFYIGKVGHVLPAKANGIVPGWCAIALSEAIAYLNCKKAP